MLKWFGVIILLFFLFLRGIFVFEGVICEMIFLVVFFFFWWMRNVSDLGKKVRIKGSNMRGKIVI